MKQPPPFEPACGPQRLTYLIIGIEEKLDTKSVIGQLLCLVGLPCPNAEEVDVELIKFVLTLMQLREQLETRQSSVVPQNLHEEWFLTEVS